VPLAICSGAARAEIEPVVEASGLTECFQAIVSSDDVTRGKPDPEGYMNTLRLLGDPEGALVFEDTEAGIASAKAAGLHVIGKLGTLDPQRLRQADELVDRIDVELMRRCLS
jgi:HAD superfamily hydrolase (TIGR01509 family)